MKVKYRFGKYKLPIKYKILYEVKKKMLNIKRVVRFMKRILKYNVHLLWILLIFIIFMSILIPVGINNEKYTNIFDGIWDFRDTILTTFIITFFVNTLTSEQKRHMNLKKQYNLYYLLIMHTENLINDLLKMIGYRCYSNIFIDEDNYHSFLESLNNINDYYWNLPDNIDAKESIIYFFQKYSTNITYVISKMDKSDVIGNDNYEIIDLTNSLDEIIFEIKNIPESRIDANYIKTLIKEIVQNTYHPIAIHRRPWRWDIKIDKQLRKILNEKAKFVDGRF